MKVYKNLHEQIVSVENLFQAWEEFRRGKQAKPDVMKFERGLEENIFKLHHQLINNQYSHGSYHPFYITDPKLRLIHKALVRDRILHHAIFKILNPIFEPTFIANSFSCRVGKGTHRGVKTLAKSLLQVSKNNSGPCWALKCDIHKFFASMDHQILLKVLAERIKDERAIALLAQIINSFNTAGQPAKGLPIGNLTSQLFANIYMNEFDQFVKHRLKVGHYVRYTDDFVIVAQTRSYLEEVLPEVRAFLRDSLKLELHPSKVIIRKYSTGVDFLGYVILPHHVRLRTKTKRRVLEKVNSENLPSYLGVLSHANSFDLEQKILHKLNSEKE